MNTLTRVPTLREHRQFIVIKKLTKDVVKLKKMYAELKLKYDELEASII